MKVKKEYREKDAIGAFGLIIELKGEPSYVEHMVDVINEGFATKKLNEQLEEV